jgi:protein O-mannosyl-transferase
MRPTFATKLEPATVGSRPMTTASAARAAAVAAAAAVAVVVLVAYWPALRGGLIWDDDAHLTASGLRSWSGLWRIWAEPGATQQYYPLLHTAFWLEHRLWGDAVIGYHLVNLAQHLVAAGLFALVLRRLAVPGALLAAAVFALHPVHVESVAWISEQKNTLSLVFHLGAALAYLRFHDTRRRRDYWLGLLLFGLALLTKSVTATLPAALLVVLWWRRGHLAWRSDVGSLVPWLVVGAIAGLFTAAVEQHLIIGEDANAFDLTWLQRSLLAGQVIWFYLGKLLWPAQLTFIYPRWTIDPESAWQWVPLVAALAFVAIAWVFRGRSRAPLAASLLFAGSLFPILGFFNVYPFRYSFVADHFQYLPSLGVIAALAAGLTTACRAVAGWAPRALAAGASASLALMTASQTPMYRDSEALYRATLQRNPECWMAHNNLALTLSARGERRDALLHLRRAIRLEPDYFDGHNNLGLTLTQAGHFRSALPHLERAVELKPNSGPARNNLGIALAGCGQIREAVAAFRTAAALMPDSPSAHDNLAKALRLAGRSGEAAASAAEAARLRERHSRSNSTDAR